MDFKQSGLSGKAFDSPIEEVKNTLIDRLLLVGAILGVVILISSLFPYQENAFNFHFINDIICLSLLFILFTIRNRVHLKIKTGIIIVIVTIMFTTDLIDQSLYSADKVLLIIIPFLSILVFDFRTTVIIFISTLFIYSAVAFLYLTDLISIPGYHENAATLFDWINHIITVILIAVILSIFVYSYNKANESFIADLEKTNNEIKEQDELLKQSLFEKNIMLQEIHHRVKNNLAVVSGLLELQSYNIDNSEFRYILSKCTNRIMSIAKVHEMLYESSDYSNIPFDKYVKELANIVASNMNKEDKIINFDFDIQVETLNVNHGVPLGVIFNELITNSIKYGFVNSEDNLISISVCKSGENLKVMYLDNGVGIEDFETTSRKSLGFTLIHSLMSQIEAIYEYDTLDKFQLSFEFPITQNTGPYQNEHPAHS